MNLQVSKSLPRYLLLLSQHKRVEEARDRKANLERCPSHSLLVVFEVGRGAKARTETAKAERSAYTLCSFCTGDEIEIGFGLDSARNYVSTHTHTPQTGPGQAVWRAHFNY